MKVIIVEPGAFRTDWQGSSMERHPVGAEYAATVAELHRQRERADGAQPGDPARAALVIADMVGLDDPPRRLLLGSGAVAMARQAAGQRATD